jgi:ribonuclease H / adenosylcobalamin/alpha-ribazole phosphatase
MIINTSTIHNPIDLFLVRHGQSKGNVGRGVLGRSNPPLTELGLEQAHEAGKIICKTAKNIQAIFSSPLERAHATAEAISAATGIPVTSAPALLEVDFGALEGHELRNHPDIAALWASNPSQVLFPQGESLPLAQIRTMDWLARTMTQAGAYIITSHCFILLTIICELMDIPLDSFRKLYLTHGGITWIRLENQTAQLRALNLKA